MFGSTFNESWRDYRSTHQSHLLIAKQSHDVAHCGGFVFCASSCFFLSVCPPSIYCTPSYFSVFSTQATLSWINDAAREHFVWILMISSCFLLFLVSVCVVMQRPGSVCVPHSTQASYVSSVPVNATHVPTAPPAFPRARWRQCVCAHMEGKASCVTRVSSESAGVMLGSGANPSFYASATR